MEPLQNYPLIGTVADYSLHLKIGEGGQAHVYLGSKNSQLYAVKVYLQGVSKEQAFQLQIGCLKKLKSPLLINMVDYREKVAFKVDNFPEEKRSIVVLELAEGGQLYEYIAKFGRFSVDACRFYAKQMVQVLRYLDQEGMVHRDIKPENILFDSNFNIKMSDFGLSRDAKGKNGDFVLYSRVGTEGYRSPEMEEGKYNGLQSDMFAIGVVLFVMYSGYPPFMGTRYHDRIYKLIREKNFTKFWEKHEKGKPEGFYDTSFKRLINSFLSADPERRPTFDSLEDDEWWNDGKMSEAEIKAEVKSKADVMFEDSPIAEIKKKMFKEKIEEKNIQEESVEEECTRSCQQNVEESLEEEQFVETYNNVEIIEEELPEYTSKNVHYSKEEPAFVVAWVRNALASFFKNRETFVENYAQQIEPHRFNFKYHEDTHKIDLKFEFLMGEEDITELYIVGQLHRSNREGIGVEWTKVQGNYYWLTAIQKHMVEELRYLA